MEQLEKNTGWNSNTLKNCDEAFVWQNKLSKDDGYGCGLAAFILMDFEKYTDESRRMTPKLKTLRLDKSQAIAIKVIHESAEAGGVLLDLAPKFITTSKDKMLLL